MPLLSKKLGTLPAASWSMGIEDTAEHSAKSTLTQSFRITKTIRSESSKADCKGYKLRGIDTGPCGNRAINYTSISLVIFVAVSFFLAVYLKTSRSRRPNSEDVRPQPVRNPYQTEHSARHKREQQERIIQQRLEYERRRQRISVRAVTDLSGQQTQLAERLNRIQEQIETALQQQERSDIEASAGSNRLVIPENVHLRSRERDWERYQMRSSQDIIAGLEHAGSIVQRIRSNKAENQSSDLSQHQHQDHEPLPEYAVEDPMTQQVRVPNHSL
ncbi:MAG: hypothetical protein L6R41_005032 [Letrouitia leprolyta]|nr:MAG: hypothetical protein L6R41_005032 [Letrouitia leprolyta]